MKKTTEPVVVRIFYELEALHSVSSISLIRKMSRQYILDIDLDFWNKIWEIHNCPSSLEMCKPKNLKKYLSFCPQSELADYSIVCSTMLYLVSIQYTLVKLLASLVRLLATLYVSIKVSVIFPLNYILLRGEPGGGEAHKIDFAGRAGWRQPLWPIVQPPYSPFNECFVPISKNIV